MTADRAQACWQCGRPAGGLFCQQCQALQPPPEDYFDLFGLEARLALNAAELEERFYSLSRRLHPDLYARKPEREKQYSLEATALLNDAHRTLRFPVRRAEYVLKRHGFDIGEQRSKDVPPELLEEVFELNMALEEIRNGDDAARPQLEAAGEKFRAMLDEVDRGLEARFASFDATGSRETLAEIRGVLNRRRYIQNLIREVEKGLTANADLSN